jgi:hypothetical protein
MDLFKSMLHEGGHLGFWIQTKNIALLVHYTRSITANFL